MKRYIAIKKVNAEPMDRLAYNEFRGWDLPEDENGADEGFLIEDYEGKKNTEQYNGYVQWVTKEEFERIYKEDK